MNDPVTIMVFEVVGSPLCVASSDGQKVFEQIAKAIHADKKVKLSFLHVESLTSAFLNAAVGQLYGEFSEQKIRATLSVTKMGVDDVTLLRRVVEAAKQYFSDPKRFAKAAEKALND